MPGKFMLHRGVAEIAEKSKANELCDLREVHTKPALQNKVKALISAELAASLR
jgi:hypothetical protein